MTKPSQKSTSPSFILDTVYAFRQSRVVLTAFELGIFTELGSRPATSSELASRLKTNERATDRLMNALCSMGLLRKKANKFSNTPMSTRFLVKGKPHYLAGLMHSAHLWHTWTTLTDAVRTETSQALSSGGRHSEMGWTDAFIAAMHMRAYKSAPAVVKLIDLRGVRRVLDLGGGSGAYAMAFARAKKDIVVTVFDLPSVTPLTHNYVEAEGLSDRIQTVDGDYTVDFLGHEYDLVFLSAIIHSNSAETNTMLFRKSYDALVPGGRIVIQDHIMSEDRTAPLAGTLFSLNMLVGTKAGDTFTESEIRKWMVEAGFDKIQQKKNPAGPGLMIGRKLR